MVWEKKHRTLPLNTGKCLNKFKNRALKSEMACDLYRSNVVQRNGPFKGGESDKNMFIFSLKANFQRGKEVIADQVYGNKSLVEDYPMDAPKLNNFKSRALLCQHIHTTQ
jgi:hypothetical protein